MSTTAGGRPSGLTPIQPQLVSHMAMQDIELGGASGPLFTPQKSSEGLSKAATASSPLQPFRVRPSNSGQPSVAGDSAYQLMRVGRVGAENAFEDGTFKDGTFKEDPFKDGTFKDGAFKDGTIKSPRQSQAGNGAGTFKANAFKLNRNSKLAASMRLLIEGDDDDDESVAPIKKKQKKGIHKVKALDAFAFKEKPSTIIGGIVTVAVIAALIAYTVYVVLAYLNRPWTKTPVNQWTYISGPWPLRMRCRAASGCYVSNHVTRQWSSLTPDPTQSTCTYLSPGEWTTVQIYFSNNPNEGLGVIFIPGPSNTTLLPPTSVPQAPETLPSKFGFEMESIVVCPPGFTDCTDDTLSLLTPVAGGLNLLFLVESTNHSASGAGFFRREWYPTQIANLNNPTDVALVPEATSCDPALFNNSWAHSRVRINAEYVELTVERDALWLVIWGAVGGALGMFMQIGGLLLGGASLLLQVFAHPTQVADSSVNTAADASMNTASLGPESSERQVPA